MRKIFIGADSAGYTLKEEVKNHLTEKGYECRTCKGNFMFVKPHHDAHEIARRLEEEKKVLVHAYGNPLLKDYLRVSTGSVAAMKRFIDAFLAVDKD